MMGLAWILAAIVLLATPWRRLTRADPTAVAALVFMGLALLSTAGELPLTRFTLEGFRLAPPLLDDEDVPLLSLGSDADAEASTTLDVPGLRPEDGLVDVLVEEAGTGWDVELRPRSLEPPGHPLVGLPDPERTFTQTNVRRLRGGERLIVCPGQPARPRDASGAEDPGAFQASDVEGGCFETSLDVEIRGGRVRVGPCDLTFEARGTLWDRALFWETRERAVALLDLYHHDERCRPYRIDGRTVFWPRRDRDGQHTDVLGSFLLLHGGEVWLVVRDPESRLRVEGLEAEPPVVTARGVDEVDIEILDLVLRPAFEDIALESLVRSSADGARARPVCEQGYADEPDTPSYSGEALCKRIPVRYSRHRVRLQLGERPMVLPRSASSVTLRPDCEAPPCTVEDIEAVYLSGTHGTSDVDAATLSFPLTLTRGSSLAASIGFSRDPADCGDHTDGVCALVSTRSGRWVHEPGHVIPLGDPDGEQHLMRIVLFGVPWWLLGLIGGAFVLQAALLPVPSRGPFGVVIAYVQVLLAARALYGFKVMAGFPHDAEGVVSAVLGAAVIPVALRVAAGPLDGARALRALACLALTALPIAWLHGAGTLPLGIDDGEIVNVGWGLGLCLGLGAVVAGGGPRLIALAREHVGRGGAAEIGLVTLLVLLTVGRSALATLGRERLAGIPIILWYYVVVIVVGAAWLAVARRDRLGRFGRGLVLLAATGGAVLVTGGDKGAALVMVPALVTALFFAWWSRIREEPWRHVARIGAVPALIAIGALSYLAFEARRIDEQVLPDVPDASGAWVASPAGFQCPEPAAGATGRSAAFDLEQAEEAFEWSNVDVRIQEYLVPGTANRVGTRTAAQVHESMAVMRRYSAGRQPSLFGTGYLESGIRRYGEAEVDAQLFDGVPSVLVASEGGTAALIGLLLVGLAVVWHVVGFVERDLPAPPTRDGPLATAREPLQRALRFVAVGALLVPVWTTVLMVGGNVGVLPFTGQSTPMLSVRSGADLILTPLLLLICFGALRGLIDMEASDGV